MSLNKVTYVDDQTEIDAENLNDIQDEIIANASSINTLINTTTTVNLIPHVYYEEATYGNPSTENGITWTTNKDGSITATGTATAASTYYFTGNTTSQYPSVIFLDPTKRYTLSGCPSGGSLSTYALRGRWTPSGVTPSSSSGSVASDLGDGYTSLNPYRYVSIYIVIYSGYSCPSGGLTFYPMLEVGQTKHDYVPSYIGGYVPKEGGTFTGEVLIDRQDGTTSAEGWSVLKLGNNLAPSTDKNSTGAIEIYGRSNYYTSIYSAPSGPTANRALYLPNGDGIIALYKGLINDTDLNTLHGDEKAGMYGIGTGCTNCPVAWSSLIVTRVIGEGSTQLLVHDDSVYCRSYTGSPLAWTPWTKQAAISTGYATLDTTKIDGTAWIYWVKTGNIVTVCGYIPTSKTISSNTTIATNLPIPLSQINLYFVAWDAAYAISNPVYMLLSSNGELRNVTNLSGSTSVRFNYTYVANS